MTRPNDEAAAPNSALHRTLSRALLPPSALPCGVRLEAGELQTVGRHE
jgi:hypothetical protein